MTPQFKFLRRVRIHGGECGAVARALHHEVKSSSLYQADLEKSSGSTNERKQMSTKTTLKRIALVAVSTMGFGLLSAIPAKAADWTSVLTPNTTKLTIVSQSASPSTSNANGFFYLDASNFDDATATTTAAGLQTNETIRVFVSAAPTGRSTTADIDISAVRQANTETSTAFASVATVASQGDSDVTVASTDTNAASPNGSFAAATATSNESNRYWFSIATDTANALGVGYYTITVRLTNDNSEVKDYTIQVRWVESIADAGATLSLAKTGVITKDAVYAYTNNTSVRATLTSDSGKLQLGQAITGTRAGWAPTLNANVLTSAGDVGDSLSVSDEGITGRDHVACGTGGAAACTALTTASLAQDTSQRLNAVGDGVYGVYKLSAVDEPTSTLSEVRVRVSNASESKSIVVPVVTATTGEVEDTTVSLNAAGILSTNVGYRAVTNSSGTASLAYKLPLTTTTGTLTIDTDAGSGQYFTSTVTWSGNYASTGVTPASATVSGLYTDDTGKITQALTNTTPVAGAVASVKIVGFDDPAHSLTITLTWEAPAVTTITFVDPVASVYVKTGSTTVFNAKVTDQFGNAVAGTLVTPAITDTLAANYSATRTYASVTSDANGMVSFSLTDAAADADDTDTVKFTSVSVTTVTQSSTVTYKATLPAVSTMNNYYNDDFDAAASAIATAVPASGIGAAAGGVTLVLARNISRDLSANTNSAADDMTAIRVRALTSAGVAATGAAITLTAGTGGHVLNSSGLPATSRTIAVNTDGDAVFQVLATGEGTITWTATSGTASSTITMVVADQPKAAGRTIALSGAATGTSNGDGIPMTVTVKDRYGNGVTGVSVTLTATGVGVFMGGATTQSITTDATGTFTFLATSYSNAGGSATFTARANDAGDATSLAGYVGATAVDSTLAAGVASTSAAVTFTAGTNAATAAAEAATDAAAEAIDAANAATDAANLAAEAADAATVAAEEARDAADAATAAVEELATQVATLMAALKAQITTLANTVAKIAKKVKA